MSLRILPLIAVVVVFAACGDDAPSAGPGLEVVATTSVLADVVGELVGEAGTVTALMEPGTDPHDFTPTADQASLLRSADLVVANGLGLEAGLTELLDSAIAEGATVVELAETVDPLRFGGDGGGDHADEDHAGEDHGHDHGDLDPHFVLDPLRVADAMDTIADSLASVHGSVDWSVRADGLRADLETLHRDLEDTLGAVPPARRKLVTNHDALGYFAHRYGFEVVGTVVPGGSTLAEPSASHLADLAEVLRREEITAVFADTESTSDLAETVAAEVGEEVEVHRIYTGSLGGEGSGADTYAGMMRTNASIIAGALGG